MSAENPPTPPGPDELAGVYVYIEADEKVTPISPDKIKPPKPEDLVKPTPEDLAGVYVEIAGEEKVYPLRKQPPPITP